MGLDLFAKKLSGLWPEMIRHFIKRQSHALARGQVTMPQMVILQLVRLSGPCTMTEIARHLSITMAAATGLVERLARAKLVERSGKEGDRRVVNIVLTAKGRRIVEDAKGQMNKVIKEVFGKLTQEERHNYIAIVEKLLSIMKKAALAIVILALCGTSASAEQQTEAALTLAECYRLALKQSETIAINTMLIKEAEAHFVQALGELLPHVSFTSQDNKYDAVSTTVSSSTKTHERKFVLKQTLFSGFKEFAAMAGSASERGQRANEKERAQGLLLVDVANTFYLLVEEREDKKTLEIVKGALSERVAELKEREAVGRSRRSEVVNAEAQLYGVLADMELVKSQEAVVRQLLEFLIGRQVIEIGDSRADTRGIDTGLDYTHKAAQRADVKAAKLAWAVEKKKAYVAKSGLLPTVSFEGHRYTARNTNPKSSQWDALLRVDVPIFEGTVTYGAIMEAVAKAKKSELEFQQTERRAILDIKDSCVRLQTAISRKDALERALNAAEENYDLQKKDYELNLVNNLEVLTAVQTLQNARRSFIHTLYETKRLYWQLCAAIGETRLEK